MRKYFVFLLLFSFILLPAMADDVTDLEEGIEEADKVFSEDLVAYRDTIMETYGLSQIKAESLITKTKLSPGDLVVALELAKATGLPPEQIEEKYTLNTGAGWGVIAHSLGIKPGSPEFKSLQGNLAVQTKKTEEARIRAKVKLEEKVQAEKPDKGGKPDNGGKPDKGKKS